MVSDASTMKIDMADFELIPEARRVSSGSAINISPSGYVSLNKYLMEEISARMDTFKLEFACHKQDKRILLLFPTDTPNYTFPSGGSRRDPAFTQSLVQDGIALPARYAVAWNEQAGAWVGVLTGERVQDSLAASLKAGQQPKGKRK